MENNQSFENQPNNNNNTIIDSNDINDNNYQPDYDSEIKSRAKKDMLYGALWCVGGLVATAANIGFIFWGAIIFGGFQFIKGVYNYSTSD